MENIFFKPWTSEKKAQVLKLCTVISFLLILSPAIGADYDLMAVHLFGIFTDLIKRQPHYFGIFNVLEILYCISVVYLAGFSYAHKKSTYILNLVALGILAIPAILDALFLIFANSYFNLSSLTIVLFLFFAINLFKIYRNKLKNA